MKPEVLEMEPAVEETAVGELQAETLYLFEQEGCGGGPSSYLWAIYAHREGEEYYAETATQDFSHFVHWIRLSRTWRCVRKATNEEYRDYFYALALFEVAEHRP